MTPLAQHLLNDWCSPIKDRRVADHWFALPMMTSAKCFECTELWPFIQDLADTVTSREDVFKTGQIFAPAPVTFIDFYHDEIGGRVGFLIRERPDTRMDVFECSPRQVRPLGIIETSETSAKSNIVFYRAKGREGDPKVEVVLQFVCYALCLINTPNLVGKITRLPHAGLQKKLARQMGMVGKFPLHAWTEITLCIDPTGQAVSSENAEVEARLSGRHCLHFVRSFLRWRLNRLERVKAHWRGDGSLGIKRSRYKLKPKLPGDDGRLAP